MYRGEARADAVLTLMEEAALQPPVGGIKLS